MIDAAGTGLLVTLQSAVPPSPLPPPATSITVNVSPIGTGHGTVTSTPAGLSCPPTCSATFAPGSAPTLHGTPDGSSIITTYGGGGCPDIGVGPSPGSQTSPQYASPPACSITLPTTTDLVQLAPIFDAFTSAFTFSQQPAAQAGSNSVSFDACNNPDVAQFHWTVDGTPTAVPPRATVSRPRSPTGTTASS